MATKYYRSENCNRGFAGGVEFQPTRIMAGSWRGVLATADEVMQGILTGLCADARSAVKEITEADYQLEVSATGNVQNYSPTLEQYHANPQKPPAARLEQREGVRVDEPEVSEVTIKPTSEPVKTADSVVQLGQVETLQQQESEANKPPPAAKPPKPSKPAKPAKVAKPTEPPPAS